MGLIFPPGKGIIDEDRLHQHGETKIHKTMKEATVIVLAGDDKCLNRESSDCYMGVGA